MRLIAILLAGLLAAPAAAEKLSLGEISRYLNRLTTAKSSFTQVNDDGTISTGTILIKRPGRMRFEYDPPEQALVVAGQNSVVIVDRKSNEPPETYPLRRTPLSLILARNVDLGQANMVTGHGFDGTATTVTAQDPEHPEYGTIEMRFTGDPVELRQWVIRDGDGNVTTVILGGLEPGAAISDSKFDTTALVRSNR